MKLKEILGDNLKTCGAFIGNIKKCTSFKTTKELNEIVHSSDDLGEVESNEKIYKKNAILVKFQNGAYVDLDNIEDLLDIYAIALTTNDKGFYLNGILLDTKANREGCLFVDETSLKPYKKNNESIKVNIAVKVLRKK